MHPVMLLQRCALFRVGIILGICVNFNITRREGHMGGKIWPFLLPARGEIVLSSAVAFGHKAMNMKMLGIGIPNVMV